MQNTAQDLQAMASFISRYGLHTGEQLAVRGPSAPMDICAVAYIVAERCAPPAEFYTDEAASLDLIEASEPAMQLIRAISQAIDNYEVPDTNGRPDVIEHVSNWVATPPIGCTQPPSTSEVIGCIFRAADQAEPEAPYCTGDRCEGCSPDEECCEASCGCCPRVDAQGWCWLGSETQEGSRCCSQHGERWLNDRSPQAELRYQLLRSA